jgi:SAM-dependent methyltransferase
MILPSISTPTTPRSPLTGRANASVLETKSAGELIDEWQKRFGIDIRGELNGAAEVTMYRCNDTGIRFFSPADIVGSAQLYAGLQQIDWYYRDEKWEQEYALDRMSATDKVLEVGCGTGGFLKMAGRRGIEVRGIEINAEAVTAANAEGLHAEHVLLSEFAAREPESVDFLCAFQVLEHVPDPLAFLTDCLKCVRPGGQMIFAVPNSTGYLRFQFEPLDWPPHHCARWSGQAFRYLCRLLPVRVASIAYEPVNDWSVEFYAGAALKEAGAMGIPGVKQLPRVMKHLGRTLLGRYLHWGHSMCAVLERKQ